MNKQNSDLLKNQKTDPTLNTNNNNNNNNQIVL